MRLPFIAAALLNACNLLLALFILPESHTPTQEKKIDLAALNPLRPLLWVFSMKKGIYSIICGSKRVVRGMGFIKKGTAIFALSFRHGKIYQPMCL